MWPKPCSTGEPSKPRIEHGARQDLRPRLVWRLSLAQLISWGSIFYMFSLVLDPLERNLGLSWAQVSLAFTLGPLARATAPVLLGVMWSPQAGYSHGLWLLLGLSLVVALALAQRQHLTAN